MTSFQGYAAAALLACAAGASAQAPDDSIYQGLGGKSGIGHIVATLVPLIQADPRIRDSFTDVDMVKLARLLEQQFCVLAGGPCVYRGRTMADTHDGLNVTNAQFNALAEDLQDAMARNGVPARVQNKLIAKLAPMQRDIVTK